MRMRGARWESMRMCAWRSHSGARFARENSALKCSTNITIFVRTRPRGVIPAREMCWQRMWRNIMSWESAYSSRSKEPTMLKKNSGGSKMRNRRNSRTRPPSKKERGTSKECRKGLTLPKSSNSRWWSTRPKPNPIQTQPQLTEPTSRVVPARTSKLLNSHQTQEEEKEPIKTKKKPRMKPPRSSSERCLKRRLMPKMPRHSRISSTTVGH